MIDSTGTPAPPASAPHLPLQRVESQRHEPTAVSIPAAVTNGGTATVAVVLASAGRPALLAEAVATCAAQRNVTFRGIVSVPDERSLPDGDLPLGWEVVAGYLGLPTQRNAALDAVAGTDVVAFFDDDAVLRSDYLSTALRFLDDHPEVVGLTGRVLLDGAVHGEIDRAATAAALARSASEARTGGWRPTRELYGCNFVVRVAAASDLRFDERLPLYGWLEDHDFARRLRCQGMLAKVDDCVIVHRAASSGGRQAHLRLGYSQVMNPVYLARKGSFPLWLAAQQISGPPRRTSRSRWAGPPGPGGGSGCAATPSRWPTSCAAGSRRNASPG